MCIHIFKLFYGYLNYYKSDNKSKLMDQDIAKKLTTQRKNYQKKLDNIFQRIAIFRDINEKLLEGGKYLVLSFPTGDIIQTLDSSFCERYPEFEQAESQFSKEIIKLLQEESEAEFNFRKINVRNYIKALGFKQYTQEIIDGMNQTCKRVTLDHFTLEGLVLETRKRIHHESTALLEFALSYVDKWAMYYSLLSPKTEQIDLF